MSKKESEFEKDIEDDLFIEFANVHGNLYGTSVPLLEIDVKRGFKRQKEGDSSEIYFRYIVR